ncbi:MAG: class I tRNA ligase family protein, partial [Oscillospiraceae bacterium]
EHMSGDFDDELIAAINGLYANVVSNIDKLLLPNALTDIMKVVSRANKYIDETAPWVLAKDDANKPRLAAVMYNLCEALRVVSILLEPFMPSTAPEIRAQIGASSDICTIECCKFGLLPASLTVAKAKVLFPRIDMEKELAELAEKHF